jgi:thiamine-phosphate pyrophosphorylase
MIDANFNRSREALRGMEEYCRFLLDDKTLSGRAKQMRHRLCEALGRLDAARLLGARDVAGDVGRGLSVAGQLSRASLSDCFTAAAKRASEGLRVLAETIQTVDVEAAAVCEEIRFEVYDFERGFLSRRSNGTGSNGCGCMYLSMSELRQPMRRPWN